MEEFLWFLTGVLVCQLIGDALALQKLYQELLLLMDDTCKKLEEQRAKGEEQADTSSD